MSLIIKLNDQYLEWSTIADAPITNGMSLEEFTKYYFDKYPHHCIDYLNERLARVEAKGTSSYYDNDVDETIELNRCGDNETHLTKQEIINRYCLKGSK